DFPVAGLAYPLEQVIVDQQVSGGTVAFATQFVNILRQFGVGVGGRPDGKAEQYQNQKVFQVGFHAEVPVFVVDPDPVAAGAYRQNVPRSLAGNPSPAVLACSSRL